MVIPRSVSAIRDLRPRDQNNGEILMESNLTSNEHKLFDFFYITMTHCPVCFVIIFGEKWK